MNYTKSILVGLCMFGLSIAAWSQNSTSPSLPGIPGYLDPRTGTFKAMPQVSDQGIAGNSAPVTQSTGNIVVNLNVTLYSDVPTSGVGYSCGVNVIVFDNVMFSEPFTESNQIAATPSGRTLICTVSAEYQWALANPSNDTVMISYTVSATGTNGVPTRTAVHSLANISVPPAGTTTTYNIYTRI